MPSHEEFLELCALSTSCELGADEQERLETHLAGCPGCRRALSEFRAVVDVGVPPLIPEMSNVVPEHALEIPNGTATPNSLSPQGRRQPDGLVFARRNWHRQAFTTLSLGWLSLAAMVLLTTALGIYMYRIGEGHGIEGGRVAADSANAKAKVLEQRMSVAEHEREVLEGELAESGATISSLRREIGTQSDALGKVRIAQEKLQQMMKADDDAKQAAIAEEAKLTQGLDSAEGSLARAEAALDEERRRRAENQVQISSLEAQVGSLTGQLRDETATIDRQEDLLAHDRDIRELMGARNLYIAEIYDVGRDGKTRKPFGRVFYTKEKSLVFYAYDLDQQPGVKNADAFQAWGQRGQGNALNLGILYKDSTTNKRWMLKFDNPKELSEINAVFVTVEPKGGSDKPTGKPLLFAYLRFNPNHP